MSPAVGFFKFNEAVSFQVYCETQDEMKKLDIEALKRAYDGR